MADVFVSYARGDRGVASRLAKALETEGWSVFWDRDIPVGKTWDEVIDLELKAARCQVVLWSREAVASKWVRAEAAEGERRGNLTPVLIEDIREDEIPLRFRLLQAASLTAWDGRATDPEFVKLTRRIGEILTRSTRPLSPEPPVRRPGTPPASVGEGTAERRPPNWPKAMAGIAGLVLVVVALWVFLPPILDRRPDEVNDYRPEVPAGRQDDRPGWEREEDHGFFPPEEPEARPHERPHLLFEADPPEIPPGGCSIVRWEVAEASHVVISGAHFSEHGQPGEELPPGGERRVCLDRTAVFQLFVPPQRPPEAEIEIRVMPFQPER